MLITVFRRRLKAGASFEDFIAAWQADQGFGVPARVFNAVSPDDEREILSVGFVDIEAADFEELVAGVSEQEAVRHSRIADVIEATELRAVYDVRTEHDFTADPHEVAMGSPESLLALLAAEADPGSP